MRGWELVFLPLFEEVLCLFVVSFFFQVLLFFFYALFFTLFPLLSPSPGRSRCMQRRAALPASVGGLPSAAAPAAPAGRVTENSR